MSDLSGLSGYAPIPGAIYGRASPETDSDPIQRAALQDQYAQRSIVLSKAPGAVPWSYEHLGSGNPAVIGWTAQKDAGTPVFPPYSAVGMGRVPDWTGDPNPVAAGSYDQTQVVAYGDYNPLNRGPIGTPFWDAPGADLPNNPNTGQDVGGTIGQSLEW